MRRVSDILYDVLDQFTGEYVTYTKVTTINGSAITDAAIDGFVHRKFGTEYFRRNLINGGVYLDWFGGVDNGTTSNTTAMTRLLNYLTLNGGGIVRLAKGKYNLNATAHTLPPNVTLDFSGGCFTNGAIIGTDTVITGNLQQPVGEVVLRGSFKKSNTVYNYTSMAEAKTMLHWPNKLIRTNGFHYENDGGAGDYIVNLHTIFAAENPYYMSYWVNTQLAGGAGAYVVLTDRLSAKYISNANNVNLAIFGVKYDANFLNPIDKKYYSDQGYTTLATDNYDALYGAIRQVKWWAQGMISKNFIATRTVIVNNTIYLEHGSHEFSLRGNGYADNVIISSNAPLNAIFENYYSGALPNNLTGTFYVISDVTFKGHKRLFNGVIEKNGYEVDALQRVQFHDFINAGLVFYGISSVFKADTISCFRNHIGVLITSNHPYRTNNNTQNVEGIISLSRISGDDNTDSLVCLDVNSQGLIVKLRDIKSEINNKTTLHIVKATQQVNISVDGAFTNGDGDFLLIDNYVGELPTIEMQNVFQNDPNGNNLIIRDLKSPREIDLYENPTAAFPHIIYTNGVRTYQNGFAVFRNGIPSNLSPGTNFGPTANRPGTGLLEAGFTYYDTDLSTVVVWNGTTWSVVGQIIVDTTSTVYTKNTLNTAYPGARLGDRVVQDAAGRTFLKKDNNSDGNWSFFSSSQLT